MTYKKNKIYSQQGYTLLELMVVVVIIAIFAAIAIPSYMSYSRKANAAATQQEMLRLAEQLERHKNRNFSFAGFSTTSEVLPVGSTGVNIKYTLNITDDTTQANLLTSTATLGQNWVIKAVSSDPQNFNFLLKSNGLRCQSTTTTLVDNDCNGNVCTACEAGSDSW